MAAIGMYGVFYAKCKKEDGVVTGYTGGVQTMGKAISANFEPNSPDDNPLYANNGVAENDSSSASGGSLTLTLDRLTQAAAADLYGLKLEDVTITDEEAASGLTEDEKKGKALKYTGDEISVPVGAAFVRAHQIDGKRDHHEVVLYREVTFAMPAEAAQTTSKSIEWQTPEISGTVAGLDAKGNPWYQSVVFPSLRAAIAYINEQFKDVGE